jgi:DNA repair protein RadC
MSDAPYHLLIREMPEGERPRERLELHGERALSNAELIAISLRTGTQRDNALSLAMRLLHTFDGLAGLERASFRELCAVPGIGPAKAAELKAAIELGRRVLATGDDMRPEISNPEIAANLLCGMASEPQEQLRVLLLDAKNRLQRSVLVHQGSVNNSPVRIAEVFAEAIKDKAPAIFVAHNHPSGDPAPSPQDVRVTECIVRAGKLLEVGVVDHLVIGRARPGETVRYVSMKALGLGFD